MTLTVCVPDEALAGTARAAVADLACVVWNGDVTDPPPNLDQVSFLVPSYPTNEWTPPALRLLPNLAVIQLMSAGGDRWLGMAPGTVTVCLGRGVHGASTAQLAVAGLLVHWHQLPALLEQQRRHVWAETARESAQGKRIVVLGAGDIARRVEGALTALGCAVELVGREARTGVRASGELAGLCAGAAGLVIAAPLTPDTHGRVNASLLNQLADGAVVVNIARGPIVETADLLDELRSGRLRAFLDVTDPEPLPADHALWSAGNVVLTPHVGGGAAGWRERAEPIIVDQLRRFVSGQPLANVAPRVL